MSWVPVNIPYSMFRHNHVKVLAEHLNEIGATGFHKIETDGKGDIDGIAWVDNG